MTTTRGTPTGLRQRFDDEVLGLYRRLVASEEVFHERFTSARTAWGDLADLSRALAGPFVERVPEYKPGVAATELAALHPETRRHLGSLVDATGRPVFANALYTHQVDAIDGICRGENALIATGTSSGKTRCYQLPILDDLIRNPGPGLRAVIVYPMNALANDQLQDWGVLLRGTEITFGRLTGETPDTEDAFWVRERQARDRALVDRIPVRVERQRAVEQELAGLRASLPRNLILDRDRLRSKPPNILITNFSMLEYMLVRPIDAPVFHGADLRFIVMDEIHSYRGVQATEMAMLIRRLVSEVAPERSPRYIGTSATIGDQGSPTFRDDVRRFATDFFGAEFPATTPVVATYESPVRLSPEVELGPEAYHDLAEMVMREDADSSVLTDRVRADGAFHRLRTELTSGPRAFKDLPDLIWPGSGATEEDVDAVFAVTSRLTYEGRPLLPLRLHYFLRAREGLFACLNPDCSGRTEGGIARVVSASRGYGKSLECELCGDAGTVSRLVEVAGCARCGYLYGVVRDESTGEDGDPREILADAGDSGQYLVSYMWSDRGGLPAPDSDTDDSDVLQRSLCLMHGRVETSGRGCEGVEVGIGLFHRQARSVMVAGQGDGEPLQSCPCCGYRGGGGFEPLRRFGESADDVGTAAGIALKQFVVDPSETYSQVLAFTDNRQRAAAFPALLEEQMFGPALVRAVREAIEGEREGLALMDLAQKLGDSDLAVPVAHRPPPEADGATAGIGSIWRAEVIALAADLHGRYTLSDVGVAEFYLEEDWAEAVGRRLDEPISAIVSGSAEGSGRALLEGLAELMRREFALSLPPRMADDEPAFGWARPHGFRSPDGPKGRNWKLWWGTTTRPTGVEDYLSRAYALDLAAARRLAERIWEVIRPELAVSPDRDVRYLPFERLRVRATGLGEAQECPRCGSRQARRYAGPCLRRGCAGTLRRSTVRGDDPWVAWILGKLDHRVLAPIRTSEHTAQVSKPVAAQTEREFRDREVDLLSSTTTFEMGVNLGDLHVILMRNVPRTAASYIQRAGRAGRGRNKDAIVMTLCGRRPYERDVWRQPSLVLGGTVNPPRVFLDNPYVLPRHLAAVLLGRALRQALDLGGVKVVPQSIPLSVVAGALRDVSPEAVAPSFWDACWPKGGNVPRAASQGGRKIAGPALAFDLEATVRQIRLEDLHAEHLEIARRIGRSVSPGDADADLRVTQERGLERAIATLCAGLNRCLDRIREVGEEAGKMDMYVDAKRIKGAVDVAHEMLSTALIEALAREAALPRYAFPLDAVALETTANPWRVDAVTLVRDRAQAIIEYAPGTAVAANKREYMSAGIAFRRGRGFPTPQYLYRCEHCKRTTVRDLAPDAETTPDCCASPTGRAWQKYIEPEAFSVPFEKDDVYRPKPLRRKPARRSRQTGISIVDQFLPEDFAYLDGLGVWIAYRAEIRFVRVNAGSNNRGFDFCTRCGFGTAAPRPGAGAAKQKHIPLRARRTCSSDAVDPYMERSVNLAAIFKAPALSCRLNLTRPVLEGDPSSLRAAIHRAATDVLGVDLEDLDVLDAAWPDEIVLYDRDPGGSGFAYMAHLRWAEVLDRTREIVESCTCDRACYDCLLSASNDGLHDQLDRHRVLALLAGARAGSGSPVRPDSRGPRSPFETEVVAALQEYDEQQAWYVEPGARVGAATPSFLLRDRGGHALVAVDCLAPDERMTDAQAAAYRKARVASLAITRSEWNVDRDGALLRIAEAAEAAASQVGGS